VNDNEPPRLFIDGGRGIGAGPDYLFDDLIRDFFVGILPYGSSPVDSIHDRVREPFVGFFRWSHCFTVTTSFLDRYNDFDDEIIRILDFYEKKNRRINNNSIFRVLNQISSLFYPLFILFPNYS